MAGFAELAAAPDPPLDLLALALATEFHDADVHGALATLDALGGELADAVAGVPDTPEAQAAACAHVLGAVHGFAGARRDYDDPAHSMLDVVLERRRGLPILLSVVYVEVARRARVPLHGVGLPGHFVVGHFGTVPPLLLDPFSGGMTVRSSAPPALTRPWGAQDTAMRMLNNLVGAYERRGDLGRALTAASLRLHLPASDAAREALQAELRALQSRLN